MPKFSTSLENDRIIEFFHKDLLTFIETNNLQIQEVSYIVDVTNRRNLYQWMFYKRYPQCFIIKLCAVFPNDFDLAKYVDVPNLKTRWKDVLTLKKLKLNSAKISIFAQEKKSSTVLENK